MDQTRGVWRHGFNENSQKTREICSFARDRFSLRFTVSDVHCLRNKLDAVRIRELLGYARGVRFLTKGDMVRCFYVPQTELSSVERYGYLVLADGTHQLNCGGCALWHSMPVDYGVFFCAIFPNGDGVSNFWEWSEPRDKWFRISPMSTAIQRV